MKMLFDLFFEYFYFFASLVLIKHLTTFKNC